jgi:DnaJ like chaperone protein
MMWPWIAAAVLYVVFPFDLLPDFFPGWGWIDDLMVVAAAYLFFRGVKARHTNRRGPESTGAGKTDGERTQSFQDRRPPDESSTDPYIILDVSRDATQEEIRRAYRQLAQQYHPDKVAHLGQEFRELADAKFKSIQQAYRQLRR